MPLLTVLWSTIIAAISVESVDLAKFVYSSSFDGQMSLFVCFALKIADAAVVSPCIKVVPSHIIELVGRKAAKAHNYYQDTITSFGLYFASYSEH